MKLSKPRLCLGSIRERVRGICFCLPTCPFVRMARLDMEKLGNFLAKDHYYHFWELTLLEQS